MTFAERQAHLTHLDATGAALADARWDRGQRLTDDERAALAHASRWGSDGYPVHKLGRKWHIDHPTVTVAVLFTTKTAAVDFWEVKLATFRRLSGLAAQERALAALAGTSPA